MSVERKLLLVDDDKNIQRAIQRLCRSRGFHITLASSGEEALESLKTESFGVVLSDQMMPGMTGAELFAIIKQTYPDSVRIMLTGYTALQGITDAINDGAVFKVLFKPWDDQQLIQNIEEAFQYFEMRAYNKRLTAELKKLNLELEERVEQKTRELSLHVRRLQVSQELFDMLPTFALGVSDDGFIVEANAAARNVLGAGGLIGMQVNVLPEAVRTSIQQCLSNTAERIEVCTLEYSGTQHTLHTKSVVMPSGVKGCLVYGVNDEQ